MRKPMVAGNWKMNGTKQSVGELLAALKEQITHVSDVEVAVFPPYVLLGQVEQLLAGSLVSWGAQNLDIHTEGAYTGEISAHMLKDFGCTYVLVGHSERRALYHESNELTVEKYRVAIAAGLSPIFCIGETFEERKKEKTYEVLSAQLLGILSSQENLASLKNAVIAYEPVWAIGTGLTASPEMAQDVHQKIRFWVAERDKHIADGLRILYGGSVKSDNAKSLFAMPDVDGGLIGGASLKAHDFLGIVKSCSSF
ncbi:MAG: triosephosphate isomerase [Gammaproteobacteria bacterium]|nr:triosephosphate isomerase [Gammaproteobacteria bacterium]